MLRLIATLTVLIAFAGATMAYPITSPISFGGRGQPQPASEVDSAEATLELEGTLTPYLATWSSPSRNAAQLGDDRTVTDELDAAEVMSTPAAVFAAVTLDPRIGYTLGNVGGGTTTLTLDVTSAPLPGAVVLFGGAVVGLGLYRGRVRTGA